MEIFADVKKHIYLCGMKFVIQNHTRSKTEKYFIISSFS